MIRQIDKTSLERGESDGLRPPHSYSAFPGVYEHIHPAIGLLGYYYSTNLPLPLRSGDREMLLTTCRWRRIELDSCTPKLTDTAAASNYDKRCIVLLRSRLISDNPG